LPRRGENREPHNKGDRQRNIADAIPSLYIAAAEGTDWKLFWEEVLSVLRFGQPMLEEDDEAGATLH
jgi:hypothetical protein